MEQTAKRGCQQYSSNINYFKTTLTSMFTTYWEQPPLGALAPLPLELSLGKQLWKKCGMSLNYFFFSYGILHLYVRTYQHSYLMCIFEVQSSIVFMGINKTLTDNFTKYYYEFSFAGNTSCWWLDVHYLFMSVAWQRYSPWRYNNWKRHSDYFHTIV